MTSGLSQRGGRACNQGMFTPVDILSTNRRDFKVKTCVGGGKVFVPPSPSQTASAGRDTASKSGRPAGRRRLRALPVVARHAAVEFVEGEVAARELLGQEDDLARVRREVFDG